MTAAVILILAVLVFSLVLRRFSAGPSSEGPSTERPPHDGDEAAGEEMEDEPEWEPDSDEVVAVTTDGSSFVPNRGAVLLVPPARAEEPWKTPMEEANAIRARGGERLSPGDFIAARVRRGAPDLDPWRLEALGRDHEHVSWSFETEEAARAALALLERRIVRAKLDEDGQPIPVGDEDFAVARRKREETEAELALEPPLEEEDDGQAIR